ncbi:hypothetical protein [Phenylobacterium deserti]|nr:hypothetical protein [Phenylobacterium deserti]
MTLEEADKLQRAYVRKRRAWNRKINRPYAGHEAEPDPAVFDGADAEEG